MPTEKSATPPRVLKDQSFSIVLNGTFDPPIFQPAWLGAQELIRQGEAEKAKIKVIHPAVTDFDLPWGSLQVVPEKFIVKSPDEGGIEIAKKMVAGVFRLLPHSPVTAVGINSHSHFLVGDVKVWNEIGHRLVPKKEHWDKILTKAGTRSVLVEGKHQDGSRGAVFVRTEPSVVYPTAIYVDVNEHYLVGETKESSNGAEAVRILESKWAAALADSKRIVEYLRINL